MKLYFVAGEASGDSRGAELMRALHRSNPDLKFFGAGGPKMRELAGDDFFDWADHAVVGLWDVLRNYPYFKEQFARMTEAMCALQPDAVILIDYPGFNLRLAKAIRRRLPATKIIYYVSPQVWAWHRGRIPRMAKTIDLMMSIFPFEPPLFEAHGLKSIFVGHPLIETLPPRSAWARREERLIGLFPGSRQREVRKIFPIMIAAARAMAKAEPDLRFEAAAATDATAESMRELLRADGHEESWCRVSTDAAHDLMQRAAAGMVSSGTATLEAALFGMPFVILYRVAWLTWVIGKRLVVIEHIGMPNILAGRQIVREFLQDQAKPSHIAAEMLHLRRDSNARETMQRDLASVSAKLGQPGAAQRAAEAVLDLLARATEPRPA
jgi:lipid-A-disaccharide synthase